MWIVLHNCMSQKVIFSSFNGWQGLYDKCIDQWLACLSILYMKVWAVQKRLAEALCKNDTWDHEFQYLESSVEIMVMGMPIKLRKHPKNLREEKWLTLKIRKGSIQTNDGGWRWGIWELCPYHFCSAFLQEMLNWWVEFLIKRH